MKILVTGAAGFVGSTLVPLLLRLGHRVTAFDIVASPSLLPIAGHYLLDIVQECPKLDHYDTIVHLAAIVGAKACDQNKKEAEKTNNLFTQDLCKQKRAHQRFIFINTNCGYRGFHCNETSPIVAQSHYAITKMAAEHQVVSIGGISLRFASLFGVSPKMRNDLLLNFLVSKAVLNNKIDLYESSFKRNFLHVQDAARAILHAITTLENGEIYNVGIDDANYTKLEVAHKIKEKRPNTIIVESEGPKDPDERNYIVSNAKIGKTGFNTYSTIDDGISELIKYYEYARKV